MARMFGYIGNRADLGARLLELHRDVLKVRRRPGEALGWGLGFYQGGEVLLRRRPIDERDVIDMAEVAENVRSDVAVGHVRRASVGGLRTENTHPFRYRNWLFAQTGTIAGFEALRGRLLESQPEFLRRDVRGETDSEIFFHLFLSFLHDAGHLGEGTVDSRHVRDALRASISLVDRLSAEEGHGENDGNLLVTNGDHLVALHRREHMGYRVLAGRDDVEDLLGEEGLRKTRIPSIEGTRFSLVVSETEGPIARFTEVAQRSFVTLTRDEGPVVEAL